MAVASAEAKIEHALFAHFDDFRPELPKAYPNRDFTPPAGGMYLRGSFQPNRPPSAPIGFEDGSGSQGILQILVMCPADLGSIPAAEIADGLINHFHRGLELSADGLIVRVVQQPWRSAPLQEPSRFVVPVTIPWTVWSV